MSQEFNLLGAAPRAAHRHPTSIQLAIALGATLALALAASAWLGARADAAERRIEGTNRAIEDLMLNLQERSQFLAQRNADPALVARLKLLERETADKGKVLDLLAGKTLGNTAGFSSHLAALGRRYPDGLWLQRVTITDGGREMAIRGRALDAALVPRFIAALQDEPAFRGTSFQRLELENPPGGSGTVGFQLATACGGGEETTAADCGEPAADATTAAAAPEAAP